MTTHQDKFLSFYIYLQIITIIDIIVIGGDELLHPERGQGGPQQQPPPSGRDVYLEIKNERKVFYLKYISFINYAMLLIIAAHKNLFLKLLIYLVTCL